jgi:hypothetical protein
MIVDLNNTSEYDKQIIHLDSANGIYNSADAFDFYIKFENPIKNISSVKILEASIILNTKNGHRTTLNFDDIYYFELNNYDRVISYKNTATTFNTYKYFDAIQYNHADHNTNHLSKFKLFYSLGSSNWTDPTIYTLNPIEQNCTRFTIRIRDKNFNILNKLVEESFKLTICVYTIKKNIYG